MKTELNYPIKNIEKTIDKNKLTDEEKKRLIHPIEEDKDETND